MGKLRKAKKFAAVKRLINPKDQRLQKHQIEKKKDKPAPNQIEVRSLYSKYFFIFFLQTLGTQSSVFQAQSRVGTALQTAPGYELYQLFDSKQIGHSAEIDGLPPREMHPVDQRLRYRGTGEVRAENETGVEVEQRPSLREIDLHAQRNLRGRLHRKQSQIAPNLYCGDLRQGPEKKNQENTGSAHSLHSESQVCDRKNARSIWWNQVTIVYNKNIQQKMSLSLLIFGLLVAQLKSESACQGAILDAGSTGTRVYIYQYPCRVNQTMPYIDLEGETLTTKFKPSIVDLDPMNIQHYFRPIIQYIYEQVPAQRQKTTPIFFSGSATLRGLSATEQEQIVKQVQIALSGSNLLFLSDDWAEIITGQEEAYYMWLSVNYLLGFISQPNKAAAIVDLGGTTAQISYKPLLNNYTDHSQDAIIFIPQVMFLNVFASSFYGYGNDLARYTLIEQIMNSTQTTSINFPCYNQGYQETYKTDTVFGTGNPTECLALMKNYFHNDPCPKETPCTINGEYRPDLDQYIPVYALGAIYYAFEFFDLPSPSQLITLKNVGSAFCQKQWSVIYQENPDNPYLHTYCFLSLYSYSLMANGFGLEDTRKIYSTDDIAGEGPSWTIGNFFYQLGQMGCQFDSSECQSINNIF